VNEIRGSAVKEKFNIRQRDRGKDAAEGKRERTESLRRRTGRTGKGCGQKLTSIKSAVMVHPNEVVSAHRGAAAEKKSSGLSARFQGEGGGEL